MDYSMMDDRSKAAVLQMLPIARSSFGPQWDAILNMCVVLVRSTSDQRANLMGNHDVKHVMDRLSADYNLIEATSKREDTAENVYHVASMVHSIASSLELDEDMTEMICSSARAVCMRHRIGKNGFSETDYDTLTVDWNRVFSPV